jgi:ABC-type transport system involved in multi-copper enzyme maturation permease subunit
MLPHLLLAQAPAQQLPDWLQWLFVWADPQFTDVRFFGGIITWAKLVGLVALLSWVLTRAAEALQPSARVLAPYPGSANPRLWGAVTFLVLAILGSLLFILEQTERVSLPRIGEWTLPSIIGIVLAVMLVFFLEWAIWASIFRGPVGPRLLLVVLLHLAFAFGIVVMFLIIENARRINQIQGSWSSGEWNQLLGRGMRYGATYAGLVALASYGLQLLREATKVRWRRLYSIAWHTVIESVRRMWAPYVVAVLFVVFLAFTNWFLGQGRVAELARMFVTALAIVGSLLISLMIWVLVPISIPNDIRAQTIYTVVTKPVRRLELIWGRLLGFMALVTVIVLVMGGISLAYLERVVRSRVPSSMAAASRAEQAGRTDEARRLREQAQQLDNRMSARVPVYGSLTFIDSRGLQRVRGIEVGSEDVNRTHIEGASPSKAIWRFGRVPDPSNPRLVLDRRIPVERLLKPDSIEGVEDQFYRTRFEQREVQLRLVSPDLKASETRPLNNRMKRLEDRAKEIQRRLDQMRAQEQELRVNARSLDQQGKKSEADAARSRADQMHSPPIPVEMTFNVFRTTKGQLGEAVRATLVVSNPLRPDLSPSRDLFPIHEYYTIRRSFPARMLVGSMGNLNIDVQCVTPSQFLGMADEDLYILASQGLFWNNFIRGLSGLWLQALVITSVGLFAGTFLSWPVALVLTLAVIFGGQLAIGFLDQFSKGNVQGGGPFESMIRLVTHENLASELPATPGVVAAKTFDLFLTPILNRLIYVVPNLAAIDVSNKVASGFAVTDDLLINQFLIGLGYAIPLTTAAYFILKKREVAA